MSLTFDATYYLNQNPDVLQAAIGAGVDAAAFAQTHYSTIGFRELRDPNANFDTSFYLTNNTDVAGAGVDPFQHFLSFGAAENRAPTAALATAASSFDETTYLNANSDVQAAVTAGAFTDGYQHWVLFGQFEGRAAQTTGGVSLSGGASNPGQTFALTTNIDNITGTSGDDRIVGDNSGNNTVSAADSIDGGAGTDTVELFASALLPQLSNVENLLLRNVADGTDYDVSGINGLTNVEIDGLELSAAIVGNTESVTLAQGQSLTLDSVTDNTGGGHALEVLGGSTLTSLTINLDDAGAGANDVEIGFGGADNLATLNLVTSNAASDISVTDADNAITTINVSGDQALTINATNTNVATLNASGLTSGGLTANLGNSANATTITGSSAADSITATGAVNYTVNLGAGDDLFVTSDAAGELTNTDSLDGGEGTDTLAINSAEAELLDDDSSADRAVLARVSNFEQLRLSDALAGDVNLGNLGFNYLQTTTTTLGADRTISGVTSGFTLEHRGANNSNNDYIVSVNGATAANTNSDVFNLILNADLTVNDQVFTSSYDLAGVNIVNITSNDRTTSSNPDTDNDGDEGYTVDLAGGTASNSSNITTVNISGAAQTNYTVNAATTALTAVNGSTATGEVNVNADAFNGTQGLTLTGGSAGDTLTGSRLVDNIIGGAGNDIINGGAGADSLSGGDGNDTFAFSAISAAASPTLTQNTGTPGVDAEVINITADGNNDNDETLAFTVTVNGTNTNVTVNLAAIDPTNQGQIATATAAAINAQVAGVSAVAGATNVTVTADAPGGVTIGTVTPGGTQTTLAGAVVDGTDTAQITTLTIGGGAVEAGDVFSFTATTADGTAINASYTAVAGDAATDVEAGLIASFNGAAGANTIEAAAGAGSTLTLTDENSENGGFTVSALTVTEAGADATSVSVTGTTVSGFDKISDFTSSDEIRFAAADNVAGAAAAAPVAATSVQIDGNGLVTFAAADDTLAEKVTALAADNTNVAANELVFFEDSGNTYVYSAGTDTTNANLDQLVELTGVTGLTTLTENATTAGDFALG